MDKMVQEVQQWLNDTWPQKFKYDETGATSGTFPVKPDGMTGNTTVKALIMALQTKLGLTADGAWGNGTTKACPTINSSTTDKIMIRIVQGGFICKGYNPGGFDGAFGPLLQSCINTFKEDLGCTADNQLNPLEFKSLLTTDPSVKVSTGTYEIRSVQQYLNRNYGNLYVAKLGYLPTGGVYERKTAKALIYAFQNNINTTADGAIGNNTYLAMPSIDSSSTNSSLIKILQCALICNGYSVALNGVYTDDVTEAISSFQRFMKLDLDSTVTLGKVNRRTWSALLQSKGDPLRPANACDCATILNSEKAKLLVDNGYTVVGRYLTGTVKTSSGGRVSKALTSEELLAITNAGLRVFAIYQDGGASASYFNYNQGYSDAAAAVSAAIALNIPTDEIIYFAVDYDFNEAQCNDIVVSHFRGIAKYMEETSVKYNVGIYGSRNICSTICKKGLASSSFVADMSTGYSGNLGFTMPDNWAFDQFLEFTIVGSPTLSFPLDKDMSSGRYNGFTSDTKCGHENYHDCTLHQNMVLKDDGYYECQACGYRVPSPFLQDKDILSDQDYLMVTALTYAYSFLLAEVDKYGVFFHDIWSKMYSIRGKTEYKNQYKYCDINGKCLFIPPDIDPTGVDRTSSIIYDPKLITSSNIDSVSGIFSEIIATSTDVLFGFLFPTSLAESIALAINDYQHEGNTISSFNSILQALVSKTDASAFGLILQLLELGININDKENAKVVSIGDFVVQLHYLETGLVYDFYIIFNSSLEFKNVYIDISSSII